MWTIEEVKSRAWNTIKLYYWPAFVVSLIAVLVGGGAGAGRAGTNASRQGNASGDIAGELSSGDISGIFSGIDAPALGILAYAVTMIIIVFAIITILLVIFIGNPILVGQSRFYMESRGLKASAGIGKVFWVFKSGHYLNVVKIMFLRDLYTVLWTFLLIIPGIIKSYEYSMIPFILSENPDADTRDVFALTKDMTTGQKFNLFLVDLSLIGWILLSVLTCGIGIFFFMPYFNAIQAEIYAVMRGEINGFPFRGFGVPEEPGIYIGD